MTPSPWPASCVPAEGPAGRPLLLAAGVSVRQLAQAAAREGFSLVALDAFGDADTRAAACRWQRWRDFDAATLLAALDEAARAGACGWIAASGFEAHPDLLEAAAQRLPLLGTPPAAWRRLRDPRRFFPLLDALGLPHPPTRWGEAPTDLQGWLLKDGGACGGRHVQPARGAAATRRALPYWQRRMAGTPMAAAFVADGRRARLLGVHEQLVGLAQAPFAWRGAVGPLTMPPKVSTHIDTALQQLVPACGLRGLGSLDFLLGADGTIALLEVNPRPGGTLQLYAAQSPLGLHLRACSGVPWAVQPVPQVVCGVETVFAPRTLHLGPHALRRLARRPWVHDRPGQACSLQAMEPLCSLNAQGATAAEVRAQLQRRHAELLELLEAESHEHME
ncbi:ATP-grasp domain-containing protein [Azohydromonas lata]|uniref:ATP-grasp domain-containing protein n=1 Tax=Azohydromonas lata TaxID=45677 RepID=A0ABU5IGI6_9BURK|nr:ATP-grasp domain-containing protein [Azohydromonas lata]MDZ5458247.1 ATP-grasp domain-containing protein [Azohydromonas lata]